MNTRFVVVSTLKYSSYAYSKYSKNWQVALWYLCTLFSHKKIQSQANYVSYNMIIIMFR